MFVSLSLILSLVSIFPLSHQRDTFTAPCRAELAMIDVYFDIVAHKLTHNDGWTATSADPEMQKRNGG